MNSAPSCSGPFCAPSKTAEMILNHSRFSLSMTQHRQIPDGLVDDTKVAMEAATCWSVNSVNYRTPRLTRCSFFVLVCKCCASFFQLKKQTGCRSSQTEKSAIITSRVNSQGFNLLTLDTSLIISFHFVRQQRKAQSFHMLLHGPALRLPYRLEQIQQSCMFTFVQGVGTGILW